MKKYQQPAWRGRGTGTVAECRACTMHVIKYREGGTTRYATWLGGRKVRDKDDTVRELPERVEIVWIRDFGGVKAMEGM